MKVLVEVEEKNREVKIGKINWIKYWEYELIFVVKVIFESFIKDIFEVSLMKVCSMLDFKKMKILWY